MNARKYKMLRRQAERLTIGQPERQLVEWKVLRALGDPGVSALNSPHTTRGVYRELKRQAKKPRS